MAPTWYFVLSSHSFLDRCVIAACIVCLFSNLPTNYLPRLLLYAQHHLPNLRASERWDTKVLCSVSAPIDRRESFLKWVMIQGRQRKKKVKKFYFLFSIFYFHFLLGVLPFKGKTLQNRYDNPYFSPCQHSSCAMTIWNQTKILTLPFYNLLIFQMLGVERLLFFMFPTVGFFLDTGRTQRVCYCQTVESFSRDYFPQSGWCIARLLTSPWMGSQCRYRDKIPHPHIHIPYIQTTPWGSLSHKRGFVWIKKKFSFWSMRWIMDCIWKLRKSGCTDLSQLGATLQWQAHLYLYLYLYFYCGLSFN